MDPILMLFMLLCSSGLQAEEKHNSTEPVDVRLVGGASRCAGGLEMKQHGDWKPVDDWFSVWFSDWNLKSAAVSVRLVDGTSLCSGRLEVKSKQFWSSVCEADFDQQDAEVVCRELGCGAPSVLQGALYGEVEAPMWTEEFQCEGSESVLLDCGSSGSARNTCSPGKAVGLTCSDTDDVRLVGGASRCAGGLEVKQHGDWKPVDDRDSEWNLKSAAVVCRQLDCGSAVSTGRRNDSSSRSVWQIRPHCDGSESALRECVLLVKSSNISSSLELICSDLLVQPIISLSPSMDGVSEAQQQGLQVSRGSSFTISCSIQPQYPGGSFHLTSTASNTANNHTQPAANHSAHFLFPAAGHAHQGIYSYLTIRLVVVLLTVVLLVTALCFYCKATRGQKPGREENIELDYYNLGGSGAEGGPGEEAGAQGTEQDLQGAHLTSRWIAQLSHNRPSP
ncbi:uncharacterized protein LOC144539407 [Centroberyx gerrardi]